MARPKSTEKRGDLLDACCRIIVRDGLNASTAAIAKKAGVASGTLFTYFPTKTALFNELYIELKADMVGAAMQGMQPDKSDRDQFRDVWRGWMNWATANSDKQRALELLRVSDYLTPESRDYGDEAMRPAFELIDRCRGIETTQHYAPEFLNAMLAAIGDATINFMIQDHVNADIHCENGFQAVWKLIA